MITNNGKNIIAKYLLNQAPEFASHIAVGVGGHATSGSTSYSASVSPAFSLTSDSLDFEAYRVPILSKGLVKEYDENLMQDVEKIVFKAELPADQRFHITEIGIFPSEKNALTERYGSKTLLSFTNSESWNYVRLGSASVVQYPNESLDTILAPGDISNVTLPAIFINSDSYVFDYTARKDRREEPRYLDKTLMVSGLFSSLDSNFSVSSSSSYALENRSVSIDLGRNLPTDKIKLAFGLVNKQIDADNSSYPHGPTGSIRIRLEFINNVAGEPKAYVNIDIPAGYFYDSLSNQHFRYKVITKTISDFVVDSGFSWSNINQVRIYSSIEDTVDTDPNDFYIYFDGLRLENVSIQNPLYSLVGAEYIKTDNGYPVLKEQNSTTYIEYRFGLGVS